MQSDLFRIWTHVAVSIYNDNNHYTTGTSTSNAIALIFAIAAFKWFQALISNTKMIKQFYLIYTEDLTGTATSSKSETRSNCNEEMLHNPPELECRHQMV